MFKTLANNRRARHEYSILKAMEAGIELRGTEVKSIREGMINLSESYCVIDEKMQAFL
ncbi:MAG: SsrA-binding protein, partial [SAR324 cluster bacterium]|nr:SsrA-binding protein [SAR324 cluster bacterium]